jgi:ABC-type Mn2+/Zn2+ transport system permease subunit
VEWLTEPFTLGFQQRALLGGAIAGVMCAVVGTWLVLRGMSFFGDAFVHGIVPGIALAVLLDFSSFLGAAVAAAVMVAGIELVHRQTALKEDTGIGLLFVGMLALGVVIISRSDSYSGSLTAILFGDALGVTRDDLVVQGALAVVIVGAAVALYRPLLALAFDRTKAEVLGMRPRRTHALLLALIAAAVIGSYQAVGTLLVFGLLVGPPATAALVARTVPAMMALATGIALVSVWAGLVLSYHLGTAGSATMALVPIVLFFLTLGVVGTYRKRRQPPTAATRTADPSPAAVEPVT